MFSKKYCFQKFVFEGNLFSKEICFWKQYFFENNLIYYFISFIKKMIFMFLKKYCVFKEILFSKIYFQRKLIFENNISSKRILFHFFCFLQKHIVFFKNILFTSKTCCFLQKQHVFEENKKIEIKLFSKKYCFRKQVSFKNKFSKTIFLRKHDVAMKSNKILINIGVYIKFV